MNDLDQTLSQAALRLVIVEMLAQFGLVELKKEERKMGSYSYSETTEFALKEVGVVMLLQALQMR